MALQSPLSFYIPQQQATDTEVRRLLQTAARQAGISLRRELASGTISGQIRAQQLTVARGALRDTQLKLWQGVSDSTRRGIARSTKAASDAQTWLDRNIKAGAGADYKQLAQARATQLEKLANQLIKRGVDGHSLSSKVHKARDLDTGRVLRMVNAGILAGKSAREIAADIEKYIKPTTPGGSSYAAMRLARTELQNAFHQAQIAAVLDSPGVIGVKWNLSGSHPEPDECNDFAELDKFGLGMGIFEAKKVPDLPHPQCLCYLTPVQTSQAQFIAEMRAKVERLRAA